MDWVVLVKNNLNGGIVSMLISDISIIDFERDGCGVEY